MSGHEPRVEVFQPSDLGRLRLQPAQSEIGGWVKDEHGEALSAVGPAYTVHRGDDVIACAGLSMEWPGRAVAWAMVSQCGPRLFLWLHYRVLIFLDTCGVRRVETTVRSDFDAGHRWAGALGFSRETPNGMPAWGPSGECFDLYARVTG